MSGGLAAIGPPEKLSATHDLSDFDSGEPVLDEWLRRRALHNEASGSSRTYVVCVDKKMVGYYTLAVGAVVRAVAPGRMRRNMPDPLPVMVLGRLAVDTGLQRRGIGRGLLRDAVLRTILIVQIVEVFVEHLIAVLFRFLHRDRVEVDG